MKWAAGFLRTKTHNDAENHARNHRSQVAKFYDRNVISRNWNSPNGKGKSHHASTSQFSHQNLHQKNSSSYTYIYIIHIQTQTHTHTLKNYKNPRTKKLIPQVTKAKTDENPLTNTYQKFRNKLTFDYLESYFFVLLVVCLFVSCSVFELFLWPKKSEKRN